MTLYIHDNDVCALAERVAAAQGMSVAAPTRGGGRWRANGRTSNGKGENGTGNSVVFFAEFGADPADQGFGDAEMYDKKI